MVPVWKRLQKFLWRERARSRDVLKSEMHESPTTRRKLICLCRLYSSLISNQEWMDDLREADVLFVATHSQGSVVSTHLLDRLIQDKLIYTRPEDAPISAEDSFPSDVGISMPSERKLQRVCCLALCGIHLGPLRYLSSSSLVAPYIQVRSRASDENPMPDSYSSIRLAVSGKPGIALEAADQPLPGVVHDQSRPPARLRAVPPICNRPA